jgi:hypothetical protein
MAGGRGFEVTTGLVIQQGLFEESTTAKHRIGTRMQLADGRVYYYGVCAEALAAGLLCYSKPMDANNTAMVVTNNGVAVGGKTVESMLVGSAAVEANEFAEGFMYTQKVAGTGYTYKIKSNTSGSAAGTMTIELYDPVQVAITVSTEVGFAYNPFWALLGPTGVQTSQPAGVAPRGVVTSGSYAWIQTWGVCAMGSDTAGHLDIGHGVHASTEEGYVVGIANSTLTTGTGLGYPKVGNFYGAVAVDAEWTPVMLQLYP